MWEDDFQRLREEALEFSYNRNKKLIEDWCRKAGVTTPVGYYNDYKTIHIYTDKPGLLIGKGGELVNRFKEFLKSEFHRNMEVNIIEIRGGFVNFINIKNDLVRVVRCKDCKKRGTDSCPFHIYGTGADEKLLCKLDNDFCSYGERA